jgi:CRISPR/Cas system CSM-associated protein Csm3 (group 7 of RAMP superfamily)
MNQGYDFVPLPPAADRRPRGPGPRSGVLTFALRTLQPVHIGAGSKRLVGETIVRETARASGELVIPGSTVKGALRARFEAITRSCMVIASKSKGAVRSRSREHVKSANLVGPAARTLEDFKPCDKSKPCPACALFGCMSLRSRIDTADLRLIRPTDPGLHNLPQQFEPRLHHIGSAKVDETGKAPFFAVTSLHGRKFAREPGSREGNAREQRVEVIPARSDLHGEVYFHALHDDELGGILAALGSEPQSPLKLGGGKCHGFGLVQVSSVSVVLRGAAEEGGAMLSACVRAFHEELAVVPNLQKLLAIHRTG